MSVIVLVLGLLAAGAGLAAIGYGVPIEESALGQTLIIAGASGLAGGLILVGLAAVVHQLSRLAEAMRAQPQPRAARPAEPQLRTDELPQRSEPLPPRPELAPRPEPLPPRVELPPRSARVPEPRLPDVPTDTSLSAVPRQRAGIPRPDRVVPDAEETPLSPNGVASPPTPEPAAEPPPTAPSAPAEIETLREPRLDFLFRSRPTRTPPADSSFESLWPKGQARQRENQPGIESMPPPSADKPMSAEIPRAAEVQAPPETAAAAAPPPPPLPESRAVAILKSGVVDGMAYTLYTDGSIEAQLPQGTVRFGSIAELRAHIESNS
jgi:hypothetical protein